MNTLQWWILLGFCLICSGLVRKNTSSDELSTAKDLLRQTLNSLRRILQFFHREIRNINLDAVIGTRMVDGSLAVLLYRIEKDIDSWPIDGTILKEIRELQALAENTADKALPFIQASSPLYYNNIGGILQKGFWRLDFASRDFRVEDFTRAWAPRPGELLNLLHSDMCIAELLGTGPTTRLKCQISPECWEKMTKMGYNGYSLTHETFYLMIGYQAGCLEEMDRHRIVLNQPPLDDLVNTFCAATYLEALEIEKHNFPPMARDIFIEQAALCGLVGYRWFFSPSWLQKIISWQDKQTGCYKLEHLLNNQAGSLAVLFQRIDKYPESWPIDGASLQEIRDLQALAEMISDKAMPIIEYSNPLYFNHIGGVLLKGFWRLNFPGMDFRLEDFSRAWAPRGGELLKAPVTTRCTCKCVLSTCKSVDQIHSSVRGEYLLRTDLGARRDAVAFLVHAKLSLRSSCVLATD